ncbi:polyhydroxyalkanoic acid system family protein [Arenimonas fontis]|uniref:Polyhydroxyalkanoic acid synthase n=1 Tax=Arenimonas fontis TaxID=2608255 RepID=A0A5B2ZDH5_9GAMM|nr:polyhydroxyalkanoic acid system family protein [Arenimonas fontis]KAA2285995.1 polyhydroxyalkanoic acid synthase [Arenimonas fontis]
MSDIDIRRKHALPADRAKAAIQKVADHLAERFEVDCRWQGNTLHFSRSGVDGSIEVGPTEVRVVARLGFLLFALKPTVENEIHRYLDEAFG